MNYLKKIKFDLPKFLKVGGFVVVALFVVIFVLTFLGQNMRPMMGSGFNLPTGMMGGARTFKVAAPSDFQDGYIENIAPYEGSLMVPSISTRNVAYQMMPINGNATIGSDAEAFEATDFNANIETHRLTDVCSTIKNLKSKTYVIFESANESDRNCYFRFKVEHSNVDEILAVIKALDPKDLSENTYTIKKQIDDFTSETEILQKKLASIDKTFESAMKSYDSVTVLATNSKDVASLSKIIDSKIQLIERLTQERLNINTQIDRLDRAKEEQLDRIDYSYFNVNITEIKFVDTKNLKDSWRASIINFVWNINKALQNSTVDFVVFIISLVPYLLYLFVLIVIAKYGWQAIKKLWNR